MLLSNKQLILNLIRCSQYIIHINFAVSVCDTRRGFKEVLEVFSAFF